MTSIDPRSSLLAAVREQIAGLRERAPARRSTAPSSAGAAAVTAAMLEHRIGALDPADLDRPRQAVRLYLEGELVREFGDGLLNDPSFAQMVDAVQAQMQQDPETAAAVDALGRWLVSQHNP